MPLRPYRVVLATPAEKRIRDALVHEVWGERLDVDQFVEREERLRETAFARACMQTWFLIETGDRARRPLASLETFTTPSRHGFRRGLSHAVASVYTEPALRGRGHASTLLDEVGHTLDRDPRAQAMTLYSDVGPEMYARIGYHARPAFDWIVPAAPYPAPGVERLPDAAITSILGTQRSRGGYAIPVSPAQIDWHRARERIYADLLGEPPVAHPLLVCAGGYAIVAGSPKNGRLYVLLFSAKDARGIEQLFSACADEAHRVGLREVLAWAAPDPVDDAFVGEGLAPLGGRSVFRDGALPMLRPLSGATTLRAESWREIPRVLWV